MATGGTPFNPRRRLPRAFVDRKTGGVGPKPNNKPSTGGLNLPPFLTFDPGISAKIRAAGRGLEDTETDIRAKRHFLNRDLVQALQDIDTETGRRRGDLQRTAGRGIRRIGGEESDTRLKVNRANQDFDTQLSNIGRQFTQLGQRQREGANAAGVLDSGTTAAGQVARGRNQALAEAPIATARARVGEDLVTALQRLGTGRSDILTDEGREQTELNEDSDRSRKLSQREIGRKLFGLKHDLQRSRREKVFAETDLSQQAIYEAQNNRPGAFNKLGERKKKGKRS